MPAGVTLGEYLKFFVPGLIFSLAGAQCVHQYYKPLEDLDRLVEEELKRRREQRDNAKNPNKIQNTS